MKKIILLLLACFIINPSMADSWDDFSNVDRMWDGQKSITNQEFEQVMEKLEEKDKQKEEKQQKRKIRKIFGRGKMLHSDSAPNIDIKDVSPVKSKEEGILMNIPVQLVLENNVLEKGFYKAFAERDKESKKIYINLYQSQYFKGKFEAVETEDDYGQDVLDFAKIINFNDSFVKFIFGSIDFNAYALLPYLKE